MRLFLAPVLALTIAAAACNKSDETCAVNTTQAAADEVTALRQYIDTNHIAAIADDRGFYYSIQDAGSAGEHPTACSNVTVDYLGQLISGKTFDQGTNSTFGLPNLITGWKEGLPLIGRGGKITLYLPPSLGYGALDRGSIPGNSILVFQIYLTRINPS